MAKWVTLRGPKQIESTKPKDGPIPFSTEAAVFGNSPDRLEAREDENQFERKSDQAVVRQIPDVSLVQARKKRDKMRKLIAEER